MKNSIVTHIFWALVLLVGLTSCEDRELITIENQEAPMMMDLSATSLVLDKNFPGNTALTISWAPATFSVPTEVKYRVEISADQSFENAETITTKDQSQTYASFTTVELNEAVKKVGLLPAEAQQLFLRVTAFVGAGAMAQQSAVTSLMITPYLASPTYNFTDLYLVGDATAAEWSNEAGNVNMLPLMKTSDASKYTFTGYFAEGGFKIVPVKGLWDPQYGLGATAGQLSMDGGSGNIPVETAGYYTLTVDTSTLSYTFEAAADPGTTYSSISIIGTVNGDWDTDTQLTQSTFDPHLWIAKGIVLTPGEFKFRADNAWDTSWGTNAEFYGTASTSGANIPLTAEWTYDVYFNDATGAYTLIPVR